MIYELVNMSDACYFDAPDYPTAAAVVLLLGSGQYAGRPEDEGEGVPLFLLGGANAFIEEHFGGDLSTWLDRHGEAVAEALTTCNYCGSAKELRALLELDKGARDKLNEARRSSLNNIVGRARQMARRLRDPGAPPPPTAPQQVFAV